jgi:hypothetical protein
MRRIEPDPARPADLLAALTHDHETRPLGHGCYQHVPPLSSPIAKVDRALPPSSSHRTPGTEFGDGVARYLKDQPSVFRHAEQLHLNRLQ